MWADDSSLSKDSQWRSILMTSHIVHLVPLASPGRIVLLLTMWRRVVVQVSVSQTEGVFNFIFHLQQKPKKIKPKLSQNWLFHVFSQTVSVILERGGQRWSVWPHNTVPSSRMSRMAYFRDMQKFGSHPAKWKGVTSACLFSHLCLVIRVFTSVCAT